MSTVSSIPSGLALNTLSRTVGFLEDQLLATGTADVVSPAVLSLVTQSFLITRGCFSERYIRVRDEGALRDEAIHGCGGDY